MREIAVITVIHQEGVLYTYYLVNFNQNLVAKAPIIIIKLKRPPINKQHYKTRQLVTGCNINQPPKRQLRKKYTVT